DLVGIADIDRSRDLRRRVHEAQKRLNRVRHVAERSRLRSVSVDGDVLAQKSLNDEARNDTAVVRVHPRPVGIEYPGYLYVYLVLSPIIEEQRLGAALSLVVAGTKAVRVDVAPIVLALRVHERIAVHFGRRRLQDGGLHAPGQLQDVDRTLDAGPGGLDGIA